MKQIKQPDTRKKAPVPKIGTGALFCTQTKPVSPFERDVAQRQRGLGSPYAQTKLVSPFGRDVAERQRGLGSLVRELDSLQAKTEGVTD